MNTNTGEVLSSKIYDTLNEEQRKKFNMQIDSENLTPRKQTQLATNGRTKVGMNDPCPCGSGKKFKKCHRS